MGLERGDGRCAEHRAVADVERGAVQRADQATAAQAALAHARVGVRTDIIEREPALARMTDDDLAPFKGERAHLALFDVALCGDRPPCVHRRIFYHCTAFNPQPFSPQPRCVRLSALR
jgi:hypothetical protein